MPNHDATSLDNMNRAAGNKIVFIIVLLLSLGACSSPPSRYALKQDRAPDQEFNAQRVANAVPRVEPLSKYGNAPNYVVRGKRYQVMARADGFKQRGTASWYGKKFHGHRTSNGETYNMFRMTAAHKNLPLPSYVYVTNLDNGRRVIVRVNDRGPFHENRIIDLSYAAAKKLGITAKGTGRVEISNINPRQYQRKRTRVAAFNQAKPKQIATQKQSSDNPSSSNQMYIQVGAFANRDNADQLREKIEALVEQEKINTGYNSENKLYRVRIGPLASAQEADRLADQISRAGIATPKIIID